jgi:hypothetical protein
MFVRRLAPIFLLSAVVLGGCRLDATTTNHSQTSDTQSEASAAEVKQTLVSSDKQTQITLPKGWVDTLEPSDTSTIEATKDNLYVTVQTETKADFQGLFSLQDFADMSRDVGAAIINNPQVSGPTEVTVNGHRALQYEVRGDFSGLQMVQLHTTVETPNNYHHILVAASTSEFDRERSALETIVQSFQELPVAASAE